MHGPDAGVHGMISPHALGACVCEDSVYGLLACTLAEAGSQVVKRESIHARRHAAMHSPFLLLQI
jgi:hypothetical protein